VTSQDTLLPELPQPVIATTRAAPSDKSIARFDAALIVVPKDAGDAVWSGLPGGGQLAALRERQPDADLIEGLLQAKTLTRLLLTEVEPEAGRYALDTALRKLASRCQDVAARKVAVIAPGFDDTAALRVLDSAALALTLADFDLPRFTRERRKRKPKLHVTLYGTQKPDIARLVAVARGNCLARWLTSLPPNKLDAHGYRELAIELAKQYGWQHRFHSLRSLIKKGAGAFAAVAQGNEDDSAGIIRLNYRGQSRGSRRRIALVGKGIIFDTGGTNLKPFTGMLGMHIDMGGSAVAMGTLLTLTELKAPVDLDVWLGVTENRTGPRAYKSQDLITALNGTTIQTIHTDAEGRMVLADTLTLAARDEPDAILDFATLTGACITAVTSRYSGVFTNRARLHPLLQQHGEASGERVWPFPIGADFADALESKVADVKQCTPEGGGDHILAATFLSRFVPEDIPWVHMDLSACRHDGGLGAVPTDVTGFGVRYTAELLLEHADTLAAGAPESP
jgi:leucyl aminopeptidase